MNAKDRLGQTPADFVAAVERKLKEKGYSDHQPVCDELRQLLLKKAVPQQTS